jgi:hypothetical protein
VQLILKQFGFAVLALVVALAVIIPSFFVVHFLLEEGYIVALGGIVGVAATLVIVFSRRYKGGGDGHPPAPRQTEELGAQQPVDSMERSR